MTFEERLTRTVTAVLGLALLGAGCSGDTGDSSEPSTPDLEAMCDGGPAPDDHHLTRGFLEIEPGGDCPSAEDAQVQAPGCTFYEWQGINCSLTEVKRDQVFVDDGYGGYYTDVGSTPTYTTPGPVVDVCWYEGVYYLPPDHPTCGRPLLQDGDAVVAPVIGSAAWRRSGSPPVDGLTGADREALTAYWLDCARLEHASVASFSRFSLDLMRLGAPPALLAEAHRAALDEIDHAQRCFDLASRYAGTALGPGPLPLAPEGALPSRLEIAEALLREGCIGETLAAVDAAARLVHTTDPTVRGTLARILEDESAHAALAWRALRWLLAEDDGTVRDHLAAVLEAESQRWGAAPTGDRELPAAQAAHGLISDGHRSRELARAWKDVVIPSWQALTTNVPRPRADAGGTAPAV